MLIHSFWPEVNGYCDADSSARALSRATEGYVQKPQLDDICVEALSKYKICALMSVLLSLTTSTQGNKPHGQAGTILSYFILFVKVHLSFREVKVEQEGRGHRVGAKDAHEACLNGSSLPPLERPSSYALVGTGKKTRCTDTLWVWPTTTFASFFMKSPKGTFIKS